MAAGLQATERELDMPRPGSPDLTGYRRKGGTAFDPEAAVEVRRKLPLVHQAGNERHVVAA